REDQDDVGFPLAQRGRREDLNVRSREELPLLGRRCVADDGKQIGLHAGVVKQRRALGGRSVRRDTLATTLLLDQKQKKLVLHPIGSSLEFAVKRNIPHPALGLLRKQSVKRNRARPGIIAVTTIDSDAAAVGRELLDIEQPETHSGED